MKILQLGKFYPIRGGVEKVMRDLTEGISERGVECDMLCAMRPCDKIDAQDEGLSVPAPKGLAAVLKLNPFGRILCVKAVAKAAGTMISPAMIRYLRRHRKEYDVIHVHHPDPMAAAALLLAGFKGTVVLHWHSDIVSQKEFYWLYRPLQRWILKRADKIVGTTPVYIRESEHLKDFRNKCTYVPIGIRPRRPSPQESAGLRARFPGKKLVLSIGRLVPYKGYSYLVDAIGLLPEDYCLVIGGTGPLKEQLERQAKEAGLSERVTFPGYVPEEEMDAWFGACNVFVLPSVMKTEAFGIVQIEAMSCVKPVVATDIPGSGVPWVNSDGVSGLNVPPADPSALAEAIRKICEDAVLGEALAKGAKERFDSLFTLDKMTDKILRIYETSIA